MDGEDACPKKRNCIWYLAAKLKEVGANQFANPEAIDVIGIYPNYEDAEDAWRAAAQRTVDNAPMRYYIADLSRLRELGSKN